MANAVTPVNELFAFGSEVDPKEFASRVFYSEQTMLQTNYYNQLTAEELDWLNRFVAIASYLYAFSSNASFPSNKDITSVDDRLCYGERHLGIPDYRYTYLGEPRPSTGCKPPPDTTQPGETIEIPILRSIDPNDITGPAGEGDARWITATETLPYTIRFENDSTKATAAAQVVMITQKLDSTLDSRSFRLGSFGFANHTFTVPENRAFYSTRLDVRDSLGMFVDFTAGIDLVKNEAFWTFRAIDPATGQLPVFEGFLPVNDPQHRGEGFANYNTRPKVTAQTGDVVHAQARIVFDTNEPIDTPEIFNTIDAVIPYSKVAALPAALDSTTFTLRWSGMDDSTGSQIRGYDVYVSENNGPFEVLESGLLDTSLVFSGDFGSSYSFFTIATDLAGNAEAQKSTPEASITLDPTATSVAVSSAALPKTFALYQNYPNPFNPTTTFRYDLPTPSEVKLVIYNILGQRVRTLLDKTVPAGSHTVQWDGRNELGLQVATGLYFYQLEARDPAAQKQHFNQTRKMLLLR
ncbi:T9SS type A sorting domain-containing protein [candidate division KSB1 bacterium]|nr:T9SS type A sorting domain-containing protein [candidate division KSB1 bacterium]